MVHEPEDIEQRAEPFIRGAGLVEIGGELFDAEPVGFAIALGERSPRLALRLRRGAPVAPGLRLALEPPGLFVRRPEPVLDFGQTALEFGPGLRGGRGVIPCGGRLGPGDLQVMPQGLQAPAVFSFFVPPVATQTVELGLQPSSLLGQLLVASGHRRELVAVLLDRPGEPVRLGLLTGRLAAGGLDLLEEGGQAIAIRAKCFDLPERDIPLPAEGLDPVSEPFGLRAEGREIPLELEAGGIEPLLPDLQPALGLVPFLAGPSLDLVDPGLELLLSGHALPNGGVEAIPVGAERFQFVGQPGEPQPICFPLLEFGAEPIPLGPDILQLMRGGFDPPKIDPPDLSPGGLKLGPQVPLQVGGVGRLAPQFLGDGTQPIVLRAEPLQLIPQSLFLLGMALEPIELLLKVVQPALSLGELVLRRGELPERGVTPDRLVGQRGADPLELTLPHRLARLVRLGRSRRR
jgi:hypothetical protein